MDVLLLLLGIVLGIVVGYAYVSRRQRPGFLSTSEFWVYLPGSQMPDQTEIMRRVVGSNRYPSGGQNPISPREGLLLSDIRLHLALVLRSKNPHVFRPDLFDEHIVPTPEILGHLAKAESLVKVRYVSEQPLRDRASIQLLPHLADVVAELGEGLVIYDCIKEELLTRESLADMLSRHRDLTTCELQVRPIWRTAESGGWVETRGLRKIGLPELVTGRMDSDEQVLVLEVISEAAKQLWDENRLLERVRLQLFEDEFDVVIDPPKQQLSLVRILRIQSV